MGLSGHRWRLVLRSSCFMSWLARRRVYSGAGALVCSLAPLGSYVDQERLPPPRRRDGGAMRMPAGRNLRPSPRRVQRALCELAPVPAARQKLVCFPPSLDPMAHEDRLPHGVPGRPTVREAAVGAKLPIMPISWPCSPNLRQLQRREAAARDRAAPATRPLGRWPAVACENCALPGFRDPL